MKKKKLTINQLGLSLLGRDYFFRKKRTTIKIEGRKEKKKREGGDGGGR